MSKLKGRVKMEKNLQVQSNWLLFFLFLMFINRNDTKRLNFQEISGVDLDKKSKLLNRIKGYMDPEEQQVVHSAEIILQIIGNVKTLIDRPGMTASEIKYPALSLEDRKRNMLMDVSEFFEDEKKMIIHQAVDFDIKIKTLENKLSKLHKLWQEGDHLANLDNYIEILEPVLVEEVKEKLEELKKIVSVLRAINSLKNKDKIDELDIAEIIQPFVNKEQRDSLMRIAQIFKVINSIKEDSTEDDAEEISMIETNTAEEINMIEDSTQDLV